MAEKTTRLAEEWTLGVEEEYQIVDPGTRQLCPREAQILPKAEARLGDQVTTEFHQSQIEIATPVCGTLADVRAQLKRARQAVIEAAGHDTHPLLRSPRRTAGAAPARLRRHLRGPLLPLRGDGSGWHSACDQ